MLSIFKPSNNSGSVLEVWKISWPIIISMLSFTAMGVADTLIVGWLGKIELAAVGLATTAIFLINSFFFGLLEAVKIVSAKAFGEKNQEKLKAALWHGILISIPCGFAVIALSFFDEILFKTLGGSQKVQGFAKEYFNMRVFAAPFWYFAFAVKGYLQGKGDTKTPMYMNLVVNLLNIVLDLIFVFGLGIIPALDVEGAALATVIACVVGFLMMFYHVLFVEKLKPSFQKGLSKEIFNVGAPVGVTYSLEIGSFTFFTALMARIGDNELAAHQIAIKIISLSFLPGHALGEAATILTGQYLGAKEKLFARRSFFSSLTIAVFLMGFLGLIFLIFPEFLMGLFGSDKAVTEIGINLLLVAGDTKFTMHASIFSSWIIMVPLCYFFAIKLSWGASGAWLALTAQIIVLSAILLLRFFKLESFRLRA